MLKTGGELRGQPILLQLRDLHLGLARRDGVVVHRWSFAPVFVSRYLLFLPAATLTQHCSQNHFSVLILILPDSTTPQSPVAADCRWERRLPFRLFSLWQFWDKIEKKGRERFWFRWDTSSLALSAAQQPPARTSCATCFTGSLSSLSGYEVSKR